MNGVDFYNENSNPISVRCLQCGLNNRKVDSQYCSSACELQSRHNYQKGVMNQFLSVAKEILEECNGSMLLELAVLAEKISGLINDVNQ